MNIKLLNMSFSERKNSLNTNKNEQIQIGNGVFCRETKKERLFSQRRSLSTIVMRFINK